MDFNFLLSSLRRRKGTKVKKEQEQLKLFAFLVPQDIPVAVRQNYSSNPVEMR